MQGGGWVVTPLIMFHFFAGIKKNKFGWYYLMLVTLPLNTIKMGNEKKLENVSLKTEVVNKVRRNKEKTGVPIGIFFEQAALEKLGKGQPPVDLDAMAKKANKGGKQ